MASVLSLHDTRNLHKIQTSVSISDVLSGHRPANVLSRAAFPSPDSGTVGSLPKRPCGLQSLKLSLPAFYRKAG